MVVGVGGIGGMRDIGDPNDPRRGYSVPQERSVPGAPEPTGVVYLPADPRFDSAAATAPANPTPRSEPKQGPVENSRGTASYSTNTEYIDREFGVTRGYGSGGGGQVTPPMSASKGGNGIIQMDDGTREIVTPSKGRRVVSSQIGIGKSNPRGGAPAYVSSVDLSGDVPTLEQASANLAAEFSKLGIPLDERDAALLAEYANGNTPSSFLERDGRGTENTRVVVTPDTSKEISPYRTIEVPNRGRDGQVNGTVRIDPAATRRTSLVTDPEEKREILHASEEENRQSNANFASELKRENRTPMISTDTFNEGLSSGRIMQIAPKGAHVADLLNDDGSTTPIYSTRVRDRSETAAPMYRVGAPTNVDYDAARDQANPAQKESSTQFDTQVVTKGGRTVETGPVPFLNREDVYPKISGLRRAVEKGASARPTKRGESVKTDHLPPAVQEGIAAAMAPRTPGGTREDRIRQDTASSFVKTSRDGKPYVEASGLANPLRGQEQSIVALDEVLNELATAGYMADPDVANGNQRLAIEVVKGNLPMDAIPERAQAEVAREIQMLQAAAQPTTRVPIQKEAVITEAVPDNPADVVAAEVRGDERNFDGDGRVVQGSFGSFGGDPNGDGYQRGFSVSPPAADPTRSPELDSSIRAVDEMYGFTTGVTGRNGGISLEDDASRTSIAYEALAEALNNTPKEFAQAGNPVFEANLRRSAERAGGKSVKVIQGRSTPIAASPAGRAVSDEASDLPQSTAQGVANSTAVSQINAPAPETPVSSNPEVARLLPYVGNGVRQSQIELIESGLQQPEGSVKRVAADQLVELFRKRLR
ncbi:MAG: hypothetical protein ACR2NF_12575 [Pirellulales bacterium]